MSVGHFCPPGSGSGLRIRIQVRWGTPLNPDPIRIRVRIQIHWKKTPIFYMGKNKGLQSSGYWPPIPCALRAGCPLCRICFPKASSSLSILGSKFIYLDLLPCTVLLLPWHGSGLDWVSNSGLCEIATTSHWLKIRCHLHRIFVVQRQRN